MSKPIIRVSQHDKEHAEKLLNGWEIHVDQTLSKGEWYRVVDAVSWDKLKEGSNLDQATLTDLNGKTHKVGSITHKSI